VLTAQTFAPTLAQGNIREQEMCISVIQKRYFGSYRKFEAFIMSKYKSSSALFLNRWAVAWYRALASVIPGCERFSWKFVILVF
jgi:hypothetical protein